MTALAPTFNASCLTAGETELFSLYKNDTTSNNCTISVWSPCFNCITQSHENYFPFCISDCRGQLLCPKVRWNDDTRHFSIPESSCEEKVWADNCFVTSELLKAGSLQRRWERLEGSKGKKIKFKISHYCCSPIIFFSCLSCTCWSFFWRDLEINALLLLRTAQKFPHRRERDYWAWIERSARLHYG